MIRYLFVGCLLGWGVVSAQPLAALAPDNTVATLSWSSGGGVFETLDDDLAALPWQQAGDTLDSLLRGAAQVSGDRDLQDMLEAYEMILQSYQDPAAGAEMILEVCPAYEEVLTETENYMERYGKWSPFDALLSVSLSPFSPLPSVTAILRVDESYLPLYTLMQETLLGCAQDEGLEITELEQNGTTLYVVGDAGDFPVVAGNVDTVFFLGTNPDDIRGVVRKASGEAEPSFADTALYSGASERFADPANSVGFSLDLAALAEAAEGFTGFLGNDAELQYLVGRASAMLKTLGGFASQTSATPEGLVTETLFAVNPAGGDEALLDIVLCDTCRVSAPFLAPEGTVGVSAHYLPWRELWAYAQDWTSGFEARTGERLELKPLIEVSLGINLDTALFDWLGSEVQTYTLEPFSADLRSLLYNPAQVSLIPVSSPEAARAGLDELTNAFGPFLEEMLMSLEPDLAGEVFGMEGLGLSSGFAVTNYEYEGVDITRLRASVNTDVAYGFVGNYLAIGSPQGALEALIDTFQGQRSLLSNRDFQALRSTFPADVTNLSYSDTSANLRGVADLFGVFGQPLAFVSSQAVQAALQESQFGAFDDDYYGYADIADVTPMVTGPGTLEERLEDDETDAYGYISDWYELEGLEVGDEVSVRLSSDAIDTYLSLVDAESESYLDENDDAEDFTSSELTFVVEEGRRYWLEVSSYDGVETGDYTLSVEVSEAETEEEVEMADIELPSFAQWLELFDLLPQTLDILADHTSTSESYSAIQEGSVYTRSLTRVRW